MDRLGELISLACSVQGYLALVVTADATFKLLSLHFIMLLLNFTPIKV